MKPKIKAYLVEWTDYGDSSWEFGSLHWYLENALTSAEEIPYSWRIREIEVSLGQIVSREDLDNARENNAMFEKIMLNFKKETND